MNRRMWTYVTPRDTAIRYRLDGIEPTKTKGRYLGAGERLELDVEMAQKFTCIPLMKNGSVDVIQSEMRLDPIKFGGQR